MRPALAVGRKVSSADQDLSTVATKICQSVQQDLLRPGYEFALAGQQGVWFVVDRDRAVATRATTVQQAGVGKGADGGQKWLSRKVTWEQPREALPAGTAIAPVKDLVKSLWAAELQNPWLLLSCLVSTGGTLLKYLILAEYSMMVMGSFPRLTGFTECISRLLLLIVRITSQLSWL